MVNYKMDSKRVRDICKVLEQQGGLPFEIMKEALKREDTYALETCLETLQKEQFIRENINPQFQLREDYLDDVVDVWDMLGLLKEGTAGVFLYEKGYNAQEYPGCYQKLAHQTAYINCYFPEVNAMMAEAAEVEKECRDIQAMGISLDTEESYGAYCLADGRAKMITKDKDTLLVTAPDCVYGGFGNLLNAGVASSKMGLILRKLKWELEQICKHPIEKAVISLPTMVPDRKDIQFSMAERGCNQEQYPNGKLEVEIFEELDLQGANGWDIVEKAAQLAGFQEFETIPRALAIGHAYERMSEENVLVENEVALVYDWSEAFFSATLITRYQGELNIMWQEVMVAPDDYNFDMAYDETEALVCKVIHDAGFSETDIFKVFMAGEWANDKTVCNTIKNFMGKQARVCTMADTALAAVKGAAYLSEKYNKRS